MSRRLVVVCMSIVAAIAACSSDDGDGDGDGPGGGAPVTVSCTAPEDSLTDSDCEGTAHPVKLSCETEAESAEAKAAGCRAEDEGDLDVCCPSNVSGPKEVEVACVLAADATTDSDCVGTDQPIKLDCESGAEQQEAIGVGCVPEDAGDDTDFDVCCPSGVN